MKLKKGLSLPHVLGDAVLHGGEAMGPGGYEASGGLLSIDNQEAERQEQWCPAGFFSPFHSVWDPVCSIVSPPSR